MGMYIDANHCYYFWFLKQNNTVICHLADLEQKDCA